MRHQKPRSERSPRLFCCGGCGLKRIQRKQVPPAVRLAVFEADKWRCYLCSRVTTPSTGYPLREDAATIDHVEPNPFRVDRDDVSNLRCACQRCNREKGAKKIWRFFMWFAYPDNEDYSSADMPLARPMSHDEMSVLWRYYKFDGDQEVEYPWDKPRHPLLDSLVDPDYL